MNARRLASLLALVLLLPGCRYKKETYPTGYVGPARQDPFLAAERFLEESGFAVSKVTLFKQVPRSSVVLFTTLQSFLNFQDTQTTLDWVRNGGHLLLVLSGGEPWRNDYAEEGGTNSPRPDEVAEEERHLLDALSIKSVAAGTPRETRVWIRGESLKVALQGKITFDREPARLDFREGDSFVSFARGSGRITLLAGAHPFRNRYLAEDDHAAFLHSLAMLDGRTEVYFLNGQSVSFWSMLWERGWMALLAGAALLLFWLWKNLPRFGPSLAAAATAIRDFTEHLRIAGAFLWQQRHTAALLAPLQREVRASLARRGLSPDVPAVQDSVAAQCGLTPDRVRTALAASAIESPQFFVRTVQDLQTIRAKL